MLYTVVAVLLMVLVVPMVLLVVLVVPMFEMVLVHSSSNGSIGSDNSNGCDGSKRLL